MLEIDPGEAFANTGWTDEGPREKPSTSKFRVTSDDGVLCTVVIDAGDRTLFVRCDRPNGAVDTFSREGLDRITIDNNDTLWAKFNGNRSAAFVIRIRPHLAIESNVVMR